MSDTTDLREQVVLAIHPQLATHRETFSEAFIRQCLIQADAAIAVVIEELANRADAAIMAGVFGRMPLADWIRSQDGTAPHE